MINSISPDLNFKLEQEQNNGLNILDLTIKKTTNKMVFDIYRKPTTSDNIIPKDSCHTSEHKLAVIRYFINRIDWNDIAHAEKRREMDILKGIICNNKFHTSVLSRIKDKKTKPDSENQRKIWAKFSNIGIETRRVIKLFKDTNVRIAFTTNNNLGKMLNLRDDQKLDKYNKNGALSVKMPYMPEEIHRTNRPNVSCEFSQTLQRLQICKQ